MVKDRESITVELLVTAHCPFCNAELKINKFGNIKCSSCGAKLILKLSGVLLERYEPDEG